MRKIFLIIIILIFIFTAIHLVSNLAVAEEELKIEGESVTTFGKTTVIQGGKGNVIYRPTKNGEQINPGSTATTTNTERSNTTSTTTESTSTQPANSPTTTQQDEEEEYEGDGKEDKDSKKKNKKESLLDGASKIVPFNIPKKDEDDKKDKKKD